VLLISTEKSRGVVSVRNEKKAEVQKLTCPLLRDNDKATEGELEATREQFVSKFMVSDLDFDRHPDLAGVREFGAKWARYCVWLYDPKQHVFTKDFLAEQMELLTNLEPSANGHAAWPQIIASTGSRLCSREIFTPIRFPALAAVR
jgi:hypothetical protein